MAALTLLAGEGWIELGVRSKRVPPFVLPDFPDEYNVCKGRESTLMQVGAWCQQEEVGCRSKTRPDFMVVEMTTVQLMWR